MSAVNSKPLFSLTIVAGLIGVHPRTIMIYEKEGLIKPSRTKTNRRLFCREEVQSISFIRFLTHDKGLNLAGVSVIFAMIEKAQKKGVNLKKSIFPEFRESSEF